MESSKTDLRVGGGGMAVDLDVRGLGPGVQRSGDLNMSSIASFEIQVDMTEQPRVIGTQMRSGHGEKWHPCLVRRL